MVTQVKDLYSSSELFLKKSFVAEKYAISGEKYVAEEHSVRILAKYGRY